MIKFYTNQELSRAFDINLARWKRWSREFLPSDPLGGLQSGYARQFNVDQAFTVYLGGFLVGDLRFTIPEARAILFDLNDWLVEQRFFSNYTRPDPSTGDTLAGIDYYQIAICRIGGAGDNGSDFYYIIRGIISNTQQPANGSGVRQQRFIESTISAGKKAASIKQAASHRVLNISVLRKRFLTSLDGV
jgi:hypothetical protein